LVASQGGKCAICQRPSKLCLDHSHTTNEVRGLLCRSCNRLLGRINDNVELLEKTVQYLRASHTGIKVNPRIANFKRLCNL
jgi:hypothetical protein